MPNDTCSLIADQGEEQIAAQVQRAHCCRRLGLFYGGSPLRVSIDPRGGRRLLRARRNNRTPGSTRAPGTHVRPARPELATNSMHPCKLLDLYSRRRGFRTRSTPLNPRRPLILCTLNVQELNPYRADNRVKMAALLEQARFHRWDVALLSGMHGSSGYATVGRGKRMDSGSAVAGPPRPPPRSHPSTDPSGMPSSATVATEPALPPGAAEVYGCIALEEVWW